MSKIYEETYQFSFTDNNGNERSLSEFKGIPLIIVNTASRCGMTYQYKDFQEYYEKTNPAFVEIIGFPCNQFGQQEPGSDEEIKEFCQTNYGVTFPMSKKIEVNGDNAHPFYKYLRSFFDNKEIGWNFEKFLITPDGQPVKHFPNDYPVEKINEIIVRMNDVPWHQSASFNGWEYTDRKSKP